MTELIDKQEALNETQQKILDAAILCVQQWGVEKTSLNDIAKMAGVTRPTVYSYFPNRNDVIRTALLQSGHKFAEKIRTQMNRFNTTEERFIETIVYAIEELPKEPYLTVITQTELSSYVNQDALSDEEGQKICLALFQEIFKNQHITDDELIEITEITTRLALSLLMIQGPLKRNGDELRGFLRRRLLPGIPH